MAFTVVPRGKSGGQLFQEAFNPFLQLIAQKRIKESAEEKKAVTDVAGRLMDRDPSLDPAEAFDQAEQLVTGSFGTRADDARIAEFNAGSDAEKKKNIKLGETDPVIKDFLDRRSADLELPEVSVDSTKVSPFKGVSIPTPEQSQQVGRDITKQFQAALPGVQKLAAPVALPTAQAGVSALQNVPQIPVQATAGLEQAALPPQLQFLTKALQAPQQVLQDPAIQSFIQESGRNLDISGRALGLGFQQGGQTLFEFLPENIKNIIMGGRQQTGAPAPQQTPSALQKIFQPSARTTRESI